MAERAASAVSVHTQSRGRKRELLIHPLQDFISSPLFSPRTSSDFISREKSYFNLRSDGKQSPHRSYYYLALEKADSFQPQCPQVPPCEAKEVRKHWRHSLNKWDSLLEYCSGAGQPWQGLYMPTSKYLPLEWTYSLFSIVLATVRKRYCMGTEALKKMTALCCLWRE